jgi:enterochelin esterase-like enzyme
VSLRPTVSLWVFPAFALMCACQLAAQAPPAANKGAQPGRGPRGPVVVSPEVLPDRRVIVRLYAPKAQDVRVSLDGGVKLTKGDNDVWEATLGPLDPGAYRYSFTVDGASVTDPRNIEMERMQVVTRSILHVPGAAFMDTKNVPHGAVGVVTYYSNVLKKFRRFHVYTPPGYEANQQKYPVLYLLHGANESDDSWSTVGRGNFILDNLIADGKAVPMIVIMPNGHIDQTPPNPGVPGALRVEFAAFPNEFVSDIMPYVESHYRTIPDRPHRAIAGLSMGGAQTLNIAFTHLDWFSAIGVFSSGILGGNVADWEKNHLAALDDPGLKKGLKMIWFSTGSEDALLPVSKASVEMLNKHGFTATFQESPGAHTWVNWRNYLYEVAPQLFR